MARPTTILAGTAFAALFALTGTAHAVPAEAKAPATSLRLTLTYPERDTSGTRTVTLRCYPAGGDHPRAAPACAELDAGDGRFTHVADGRACTMIYAPVVASAEGRWRGRSARFSTRYGNVCEMRAHTGTIFDF